MDLLSPRFWPYIVTTLAVALAGPFLIIVGIQLLRLRRAARNALETFLWIAVFAVPPAGIALIVSFTGRQQPPWLVLWSVVILAHWLSFAALLIWVRLDRVKRAFSERSVES